MMDVPYQITCELFIQFYLISVVNVNSIAALLLCCNLFAENINLSNFTRHDLSMASFKYGSLLFYPLNRCYASVFFVAY